MADSNLDTLNVRLLNFTGPTIYKDGVPWIPTIGNEFCFDYLGVGKTVNCPPGPPGSYPPSLQVTENAKISNTLFLSPEQGHLGGIQFQSNNPIGQPQQAASTIKFSNNFTTDASGFLLGYNGTTDTSLNMISDTLNLFRLGDISNAIITIVGNTGYIGINKSSPSTDVDISGNVTIRGFLDMSCNPIKDVSGIFFCKDSSGIDMACNSITDVSGIFFCKDSSGIDMACNSITDVSGIFFCKDSSGIDMACNSITDVSGIFFCKDSSGIDMACNSITDVSKISFCPNGGGIDLSCNPIKDVSGIYFCDHSSLTTDISGLDISGAGISFLTNSGTEQMRIDMSGNVGIGTTTPQAKLDVSGRIFVIDACNNVVVGSDAMTSNTTGKSNTVFGEAAMQKNTTGYYNTAIGWQAMQKNTTGYNNAVFGVLAMLKNTTGYQNTAIGGYALRDCSSGKFNTAVGMGAGFGVTTGTSNVAIGVSTLASVEVTGNNNVAIGMEAMDGTDYYPLSVQSGSYNVVLGGGAGQRIKTGDYNIAIGRNALGGYSHGGAGGTAPYTIIGPSGNIAIGRKSMWKSGDGSGGTGGGGENVGLGQYSLQENNDGSGNVAVGHRALEANSAGNYNSALGYKAGGQTVDNSNNSFTTCLGYQAYADISNVVILGDPNDASNNVGIGTSAPTEKLDVSGNVKIRNGHLDMSCNPIIDVSKISFCPNGGGIDLSCNPIKDVGGIYFCDGASLTTDISGLDISGAGISFLTNSGTEQMRIDMSGNVGIGTDSPDCLLDVRGPSGGIQSSLCRYGGDKQFRTVAYGGNTTNTENGVAGAIGLYHNTTENSMVRFHRGTYAEDGFMSFTTGVHPTGGQERMRLDNFGRLGIGTDSPTETLDVSGNVKIRNGHLDMSCNSIRDVSGLYFCHDSSGIDMSCNPIRDVSGIYFCDGSSFTSGNSLDISASTVHISGTNLIVDASCTAQFFASNSGEFISNAPDGHLRLKPKTGTGNITIYDGGSNSGSIVIQPDPSGNFPGGLVRIDASECLVPYIVGPNIQPNSAATKQYVDNMVQGVTVFDHVDFATTSEITGTFPPQGFIAIDGVSPIAGQRVLIKDQPLGSGPSDARHNGIYKVVANGAWTRASDMSNNTNVAHALIFVDNGVINNNTSWVVTGVADQSGNVFVNQDEMTFSKFGAAGILIPGAGLYQSGQALNVGASSSTQIVTTSLSPSIMDTWKFHKNTTAYIDISGGTIYGGTQSAIESIQCLGPFTAETLTLTGDISQNLVFAGPSGSSGAPTFRKLETTDMPSDHTASQWVDSSGGGLYFTGGPVGIGKTDPSGALDVTGTITATSFNAVSDLNKKENIDTILNATEKMTLLRGVSYNLKSDKNKKKHYGVIAQELEQIFPDMVNGEEGNKSVAYMEIIGVLIETVKDLNKRIENLEQSSNN